MTAEHFPLLDLPCSIWSSHVKKQWKPICTDFCLKLLQRWNLDIFQQKFSNLMVLLIINNNVQHMWSVIMGQIKEN